ncbi:MAG: 3-isopropylmalate dehydratase small subunit [Acidimicrobiia bacterium]
MDAVELIVGRAAPLNRADVDTDQIIPAHWLKRIERTGFGEGCFEAWRKDPNFVLNNVEYEDATILVAGPNFGCGSSREHAPWALQDYGFRAIVAPSFADIFRNNCAKIGLVPAPISPEANARLMAALEADPTLEVIVDVVDRRVTCPAIDLDEPFSMDDHTQHRLLNGLDDIGITLQDAQLIGVFEPTRASWLPVVRR